VRAAHLRALDETFDELRARAGPSCEHAVERLEPLARLLRIGIGCAGLRRHEEAVPPFASIPRAWTAPRPRVGPIQSRNRAFFFAGHAERLAVVSNPERRGRLARLLAGPSRLGSRARRARALPADVRVRPAGRRLRRPPRSPRGRRADRPARGACILAFVAAVVTHVTALPVYLAILAVIGTARAFGTPATRSLLPSIVAPSGYMRAQATFSSLRQMTIIGGPALGGVLVAISTPLALGVAALGMIASAGFLRALSIERPVHREPPRLRDALDGLRYIRSQPVVLAAISLDLFAVLFGGATALLPAFADGIFHAGPQGLGALRSAPAVGAALVAAAIARRPLQRHVGPVLLVTVTGFGLATIAFGLSRNFALSLAMLALTGATDMVSVVIRNGLVQLSTPDAMRGRVNAVENVFIGASNELGEFESGMLAALIGVVARRRGRRRRRTIAVIAIWKRGWFFQKTRRSLRPCAAPTARSRASFDNVPAIAKSTVENQPSIGAASGWSKQYAISVVSRTADATTYRLLPLAHERVRSIDAVVQNASGLVQRYVWSNSNGLTITSDQTYESVGGYQLVGSTSTKTRGGVRADSQTTFTNYQLNVALPDSVFTASP
jgi:MFS family permease